MINIIRQGLPLPVYGRGENIRDRLWVEDHARAMDSIFHRGVPGETYNIGRNNERRNIDLVRKLCDLLDQQLGRTPGESAKLITIVADRAGHAFRYSIDASKLQRELGWTPSVRFDEGFQRTIDWNLENEAWLENVTSGTYQRYYESVYGDRLPVSPPASLHPVGA
jgi:dTDP-glucose 4,6-dehydratase